MLHESYVKPKEEYQFCLGVLTEALSLLTENTHCHNNLCERVFSFEHSFIFWSFFCRNFLSILLETSVKGTCI